MQRPVPLRLRRMLEIDRKEFTITLLELPEADDAFHFEPLLTFPIAIGAKGYATKPGCRRVVETKKKDPVWWVPDSEWAIEAGLVPGTQIPGGDPANPIRERWLGIDSDEGIGIHGTTAYWSIGTRASHGCIRMLPEDVIVLYDAVPRLTPVVVL